jgi:hypothetical protein
LPSLSFRKIRIKATAEILSVEQVRMPTISDKPGLDGPSQERFPRMSSSCHQHNGSSVAILLRAIFDADLTLHPGEISLPGFFAEKLLIVMD